jgi:hypothetical protein
MGNISGAVGHLKEELRRAQQEFQRFTTALAALGSAGSNGQPTQRHASQEHRNPPTPSSCVSGEDAFDAT